MAANAVECEFPDKDLFERWQNQDRRARDQIFVALWDKLVQIGCHTCNAAFRYYRGRDALAQDVARQAFLQVWRRVNRRVQSKEIKWQGCSEFNGYFYRAYMRALYKAIQKQHEQCRRENGFEQEPDTLSGAGHDLDQRSMESRHDLVACVHYYSYVAQRLQARRQAPSCEVANAVVLYLKCEIARHSKTYDGSSLADLPVAKITQQSVEDLLAEVEPDRVLQIGSDASSRRFRDFLMPRLCNFELSDEMRRQYCDALQVQFTIREQDGRRRRITQTELMQAHKASRRQTPDDALIDEAYRALVAFLTNRALVDKRWSRFKADCDALQYDDRTESVDA